MRITFVLCALASLALAACESSPEVNSGSSGASGSSAGVSASQPTTTVTSGTITSERSGAQAPGSVEFVGHFWQPPEAHHWQHETPKVSGGLRIYEAHVGMASEEGKVAS